MIFGPWLLAPRPRASPRSVATASARRSAPRWPRTCTTPSADAGHDPAPGRRAARRDDAGAPAGARAARLAVRAGAADSGDDLGSALEGAAAEVERQYTVPIEVVRVGGTRRSTSACTRSCSRRARRWSTPQVHSQSEQISVFLELEAIVHRLRAGPRRGLPAQGRRRRPPRHHGVDRRPHASSGGKAVVRSAAGGGQRGRARHAAERLVNDRHLRVFLVDDHHLFRSGCAQSSATRSRSSARRRRSTRDRDDRRARARRRARRRPHARGWWRACDPDGARRSSGRALPRAVGVGRRRRRDRGDPGRARGYVTRRSPVRS